MIKAIPLLLALLLSGCAGIHGEAQATHEDAAARADVLKVPFP